MTSAVTCANLSFPAGQDSSKITNKLKVNSYWHPFRLDSCQTLKAPVGYTHPPHLGSHPQPCPWMEGLLFSSDVQVFPELCSAVSCSASWMGLVTCLLHPGVLDGCFGSILLLVYNLCLWACLLDGLGAYVVTSSPKPLTTVKTAIFNSRKGSTSSVSKERIYQLGIINVISDNLVCQQTLILSIYLLPLQEFI